MDNRKEVSVFWFRRDLRLEDNAGLYHALKQEKHVLPVFIFDTGILDRLDNKEDRRVSFIHAALVSVKEKLEAAGSSLLVLHTTPLAAFKELISRYAVRSVYANHDYEPEAIVRDKAIKAFLAAQEIRFLTFKDQVIFEGDEVLKPDKTPYTIYTPYSKVWKRQLSPFYYKPYPGASLSEGFYKADPFRMPALKDIGFSPAAAPDITPDIDTQIIGSYDKTRNFPAVNGTTRLSVHLRFGTVSIRQLVKIALAENETWLNELIWRDFFMSILYHFPKVVHHSFKAKYEPIKWRNDEADFARWCAGNTGFPIVDAGMRELNATGFMHNRVRMIVAGFLTKHLLIDWRWGEAYFAEKLDDYELSSNNGNWQWAAGCGCDAAPYFRVFNPEEQQKKFDPECRYIKQWVPEFGTGSYARPMVEHKMARERALAVYKAALQEV